MHQPSAYAPTTFPQGLKVDARTQYTHSAPASDCTDSESRQQRCAGSGNTSNPPTPWRAESMQPTGRPCLAARTNTAPPATNTHSAGTNESRHDNPDNLMTADDESSHPSRQQLRRFLQPCPRTHYKILANTTKIPIVKDSAVSLGFYRHYRRCHELNSTRRRDPL